MNQQKIMGSYFTNFKEKLSCLQLQCSR